MIEQLTPFGSAAVTVTGSVHENKVPRCRSHTEERQSFGAALQKCCYNAATVGERAEPYRLLTGSNQPPPSHYSIEQRGLANIGSSCRGLACLSGRRIGLLVFCTANL